MKDTTLVEKAKEGNRAAFGALFERYRGRAYGFFLSRTGDGDLAEDLCQEAFIKAYLALAGLRDPGSFGSWFFSICRNSLRAAANARKTAKEREDSFDDERNYGLAAWESYPDLVRIALALLPAELHDLVVLRHFCALDYASVAAACGIDEKLVKSRLHRAKILLRAKRLDIEAGIMLDPARNARIKENIMNKIDEISRFAYCIERLSLTRQLDLCRSARENAPFSSALLASLSEIKAGKEWILAVHSRVSMAELTEALVFCDRYTEKRIIDALDEVDPELAELMKQMMFVFEDFVLFDTSAIRLLIERSDRATLALALSSQDKMVLNHFLSALPAGEGEALKEAVCAAVGGRTEMERAAYDMIQLARTLDLEGSIEFIRASENSAEPRIVARAR